MKSSEGFFKWTAETIAKERQRCQSTLLAGLDILKNELPPVGDAVEQ